MKRGKGGFLSIALFALAATLLVFSVVGSSQALLTYRSRTYGAQVDVQDIGVTLVERGETVDSGVDISRRNYDKSKDNEDERDNWDADTGKLVQNMLAQNEKFKLGTWYREELSVRNTGTIDEYVRVTVYKYWEKNGGKNTSLDPSLIKLNLVNDDVWYHDKASDTDERIVLYYKDQLLVGASTPDFADAIMIEAEPVEAAVNVTREEIVVDGSPATRITTTYDYDDATFVLDVTVDAVQTHNAEDAIRSAWGVNMAAMEMR